MDEWKVKSIQQIQEAHDVLHRVVEVSTDHYDSHIKGDEEREQQVLEMSICLKTLCWILGHPNGEQIETNINNLASTLGLRTIQ